MLKTIKLSGTLAKKFGKQFRLDVTSAREAVHAIAMQLPEFAKFMLESDKLGLKFAVFLDKKNIGEDDLDNVTDAEVIRIVPKVVGAGGNAMGILQVVAGAVMIGAAFFTGGASMVAWGALQTSLFGAGLGLLMGGVVSMLMPTPKMDKQDPDGNKASKGFGGAVTTVAQGNPVPILYGEREIGGFFASGGIYAEDKA